MPDDKTTIQISSDVHEFLEEERIHEREPFNDVLKRVLGVKR